MSNPQSKKRKNTLRKQPLCPVYFVVTTLYIFLLLPLIALGNQSNTSSPDNPSSSSPSTSSSDTNSQINQKQEEIENLESKIHNYQEIINQKEEQQATLANQISIMEERVKSYEENINKTAKEMELLQLEISVLDLKIEEKTISLEHQQTILRELVRVLQHESNSSDFALFFKYPNLGSYFAQLERINTMNQNVKTAVATIREEKTSIEEDKKAKEDKFQALNTAKEENEKSKQYLEGEQEKKSTLLSTTQNEEARYQDLLRRVEQQKNALLGDISTAASSSQTLSGVIAQQAKPKTGLASTRWYFSQRDSRWASENIGLSDTKMAAYGCAVTCVSMIFRYHGVSTDPGLLAKAKIFYYDLIVWPDSWSGEITRNTSYSHGNIDWDVVDKEIANNTPVIVFVRANGRGAGHYVVIHHKDKNGEYVVHDPYWGANIFLSSTEENISVLYNTSTSIDQMIIYHGPGSSNKGNFKVEDAAATTTNTGEDITSQKECETQGGVWSTRLDKCYL